MNHRVASLCTPQPSDGERGADPSRCTERAFTQTSSSPSFVFMQKQRRGVACCTPSIKTWVRGGKLIFSHALLLNHATWHLERGREEGSRELVERAAIISSRGIKEGTIRCKTERLLGLLLQWLNMKYYGRGKVLSATDNLGYSRVTFFDGS